MKKSQLRKIIKEVIMEQGPIILQEQTGVPPYACSPSQMLSSFAAHTSANNSLNWQQVSQCMPTVRQWLMNMFKATNMQTPLFSLYCHI